MKALIIGNKVVDIAIQEFPVAEPLFWVDCPDNCPSNSTRIPTRNIKWALVT